MAPTENLPQIKSCLWKREFPSGHEELDLPEVVLCGFSEQKPSGPSCVAWHRCVLLRREAAPEQFSRARRKCQTEQTLCILPAKCGRQARIQDGSSFCHCGVKCSTFLSLAYCCRLASFPIFEHSTESPQSCSSAKTRLFTSSSTSTAAFVAKLSLTHEVSPTNLASRSHTRTSASFSTRFSKKNFHQTQHCPDCCCRLGETQKIEKEPTENVGMDTPGCVVPIHLLRTSPHKKDRWDCMITRHLHGPFTAYGVVTD